MKTDLQIYEEFCLNKNIDKIQKAKHEKKIKSTLEYSFFALNIRIKEFRKSLSEISDKSFFRLANIVLWIIIIMIGYAIYSMTL